MHAARNKGECRHIRIPIYARSLIHDQLTASFCGVTEDFCGDRIVARPTCSNTNPISRVVGYYEGWAARRSCQVFTPEDIPAGAYSHLNFAFAGIDPHDI